MNWSKENIYFFRLAFIVDKKDVTISIEGPNDLVDYDSTTGTIKIRSRPSIPVNLKLSIKNLAKESEQMFVEEILSDENEVAPRYVFSKNISLGLYSHHSNKRVCPSIVFQKKKLPTSSFFPQNIF